MKKFKNKNAGITLIALIITIIVLLILAGVSIASITGDNGVLNKANKARVETDKGTVLEKIKLAVLASYETDGEIDTTRLENELKKYFGNDVSIQKGTNGKLPWTVTENGYKFEITANGRVQKVMGVILSSSALELEVGKEQTLTAELTEGSSGTIVWESSDSTVATVVNGKVTAVGEGTTEIIAKIQGTDYSSKCSVTVVVPEVTLSDTTGEIQEGNTLQLTATLNVTTTENIVWSTSDNTIATVVGSGKNNSTGTVTGVTAGTVTITATYGEVSETCTITVKALEPIDPEDVATGGDDTWTRANGQIEIEFLTGTSYTTGNANAPLIDEDEMIPVNWNGTNWVVTDQVDWDYSYGTTDSTKKWANVMLRDTLELDGMDSTAVQTASIADMKGKTVITEGSMLVWLPRYAYRIVYFDTETNEGAYRAGTLTEKAGLSNGSIVGYSDARGLVDATGKTPTGMDIPVTSIAVGEKKLRPHPAFEDGSKTGYTQGEWDKKITGIWIGKFETTSGTTIRPNTSSDNKNTIGNYYTYAQNLGIANSHMAKNSEWGAMAYLTESIYGRNGVAVETNDKKITGEGNYKKNLTQSTTGNIYGIYDTVGGVPEYTASYIPDNSQTYGNSFASINPSASGAKNDKKECTKFATAYEMSESKSKSDNYNKNINRIFGDATIEISTGGGYGGWYSSHSNFMEKNYPFAKRSNLTYNSGKSTLTFNNWTGDREYECSYRMCMSVQ